MTIEEHLKQCKKCLNRKLDMNVGLLCELTGEMADFEGECKSFRIDDTVLERMDDTETLENHAVVRKLSERNIALFKTQQDYPKALLTGIIVGILGALLWGVITLATGYQIGYMAIAIGAAVGYSIRLTGNGIDQIFGITSAAIAVLSCALGNFFSVIGQVANYEGLGYIETLTLFDYNQTIPLMSETFSFIDILFYGFAAYQGYKLAFRAFTEKEVYELEN